MGGLCSLPEFRCYAPSTMPYSAYDRFFRVLIIGGGGCQELMSTFSDNNEKLFACEGNVRSNVIKVGETKVALALRSLDVSAGDCDTLELFRNRDKTNGFVFLYNVCEEGSFARARTLLAQAAEKFEKGFPKILVGHRTNYLAREVSVSQGEDLAEEFGCDYLETTVMNQCTIDDIFQKLSENMLDCK